LDDTLSNQLAIYIMQELDSNQWSETQHLECMILAFANYLNKKYINHFAHKNDDRVYLSYYKMKKIDEYIRINIDKNISTLDLSILADLSVSHFIRMFKKTTSYTPYQYIKKVKMEKAKDLLLETKSSIIQVALESGFENPSHFAQVFKNLFGFTPMAYRKKLKSVRTEHAFYEA